MMCVCVCVCVLARTHACIHSCFAGARTQDYDEDFETDEAGSPKKAASPKMPQPKPSAPPVLPKNVNNPTGVSNTKPPSRQSKAIDPKVLEMQRAMAMENEAAANVDKKGGREAVRQSQAIGNRHAPRMETVRQSQAGPVEEVSHTSSSNATSSPNPPAQAHTHTHTHTHTRTHARAHTHVFCFSSSNLKYVCGSASSSTCSTQL